ncbi:MAG: AAA family ATPase, partial [Duncaniella sp.]|nr:AAA family ATPase [Duncaniella sp.]
MDTPLSHIENLRRLLRIEYEAERDSFVRITDRIGLVRLAERGRAWFPLRAGKCYYNSLNQRVVEVFRADGGDPEQEHEFEYGRAVMFFTTEGTGKPPARRCAGTVSYVDGDRMVVAVADGADLGFLNAPDSAAGVMISFDETSYRVMFEALDAVAGSKGRLGELRDLFSSRRKAAEFSIGPVGIPYLNASQAEGVNKVLRAKDVAIVHGPPGTGKTTTLVEAIHETLRRESQVMVCAQSNMAVDWISEKLVDRGISVLRLGNPSRVNDKMLSFTYERRFEDHPVYPT